MSLFFIIQEEINKHQNRFFFFGEVIIFKNIF